MRSQIAAFRLRMGGVAVVVAVALAGAGAQQTPDPSRGPLDQILDLYVRDGYVYYRSLRSDRSRLDRHISAIAARAIESEPRQEQIAFWINAYNALVLRTVIEHFPIRQRSNDYPPQSIRQIPGAFERLTHRVAGRTLTLDQIEQTILAGFRDPRVFFALGRGAVGGGRLRSEVFTAEALERQLSEVADECVGRSQCVTIDRPGNTVLVSSIFSWRREEFAAAYADRAAHTFSSRSPIERAVLAFIGPGLLATEREFLEKNAFTVEYAPFDWVLNDLTGRGGR